MRKRWLLVIGALLLLAAGAAVAGVLAWQQRSPGTIRGSASIEFETTEEPGATTRPEEVAREIPWPTYGYDEAGTRFAPEYRHRPPFREIWRRSAGSLMEFPPVVGYGRLYVGTITGRFIAVDAETGRVDWERRFGRCTAAAPVIGDGVVYQPLMDPTPCREREEDDPGFLMAMDADTGEILWRFRAGVIESSPLLVDGVLYFGSWDQKVYALDAKTKRVLWTFETDDQVKGGPAYRNGTIFIGSYDGNVYALNARTGRQRWAASGVANFYATPAVAYGRVYIGNTDGRVYAFGARTGNLLWAKSTGSYVYSSAAVWNRRVYVGSHDSRFYALDAGTGDVRWSFDAKGRISGSATVIEGVVYFSTLEERTFALDARTGRKIWEFPDGKYTPIVADDDRLYLTGYRRLYGLEPRR
ncbi:MAG: PQQ-binding-like beta-propeller repeat protein [Candidatus Rokuibacteriota bacterium]